MYHLKLVLSTCKTSILRHVILDTALCFILALFWYQVQAAAAAAVPAAVAAKEAAVQVVSQAAEGLQHVGQSVQESWQGFTAENLETPGMVAERVSEVVRIAGGFVKRAL